MLCTQNPWLVLERYNFEVCPNQYISYSKGSAEQHESAGEMKRRGKPLWEGNSCALEPEYREAAGVSLGSVQHPSPSEKNQSGQGGQTEPVRQPGHVHCQKMYKEVLNRG